MKRLTPPSGYRLVIAKRDYPMGGPVPYFIKSGEVTKRRPGLMICAQCRVYSNAWGLKQVCGFFSTHNGHAGVELRQ